jgi:hypothetical protein
MFPIRLFDGARLPLPGPLEGGPAGGAAGAAWIAAIRPLALIAAVAINGAAPGQLREGYYNDEDDYALSFPGMLDFDQVRTKDPPDIAGLPGDGLMYCVPTATMDLLAHLASRYLLVDPGTGNYDDETDQDAYNAITEYIDELGDLMDTDSSDGTYPEGWLDGTRAWLDSGGFVQRLFGVDAFLAWDGYDVTADRAAYYASQGVVAVCYGYYDGSYAMEEDDDGSEYGVGTLGSRNGGHCVALYSIESLDSMTSELQVMDPSTVASGDDQYSQSVMTPTERITLDVLLDDGSESRYYSVLEDESSSMRVIDQVYLITPARLVLVDAVMDLQNTIQIRQFVTAHGQGTWAATAQFIVPGPVREVTVRPDYLRAVAVTAGAAGQPTRPWLIDLQHGGAQALPEASGPVRAAFNRFLELYVSDGSSIRLYNVDSDTPRSIRAIELPITVSAMDFIDESDELWVLDGDRGRILALSRRLIGPAYPLPGDELFEDLATDPAVRMTAIPGGGIALLSPQHGVAAIFEEGDGSLSLTARYDAAEGATDVSATDGRTIVIARQDGSPLELIDDGLGNLQPIENGPLGSLPPATVMELSRSRTNFDPAIHGGPGWRNGRRAAVPTSGDPRQEGR